MESQQSTSSCRQTLPPHQVDCIWWKKGYCYRGTKCFFRHDAALAGIDKNKDHTLQTAKASRAESSQPEPTACPSTSPAPSVTRESCAICLDIPVTYGLLIHCDHVFCLECIRNWRSSSNSELHEDPYSLTDTAALSKTTKTCPLCRKKSDFIIPSSIFPTPPTSNDLETAKDTDKATRGPGAGKIKEIKNPVKEEIIQGYLSKLKKIPCRYFEEEVKRWREAVAAFDAGEVESCLVSPLRFRPRCFFANQCHYAHIDPATNKPYTFSPQEIRWMKRKRIEERSQQLRARFHITPSEHFDILTRSLEAFSFGEDVLRDSPMRNTSERPAPARPALARPALDVQSLHVALTLAAAFDDMELSDSVDYDFDLEAPHGELLGDYEDDYY